MEKDKIIEDEFIVDYMALARQEYLNNQELKKKEEEIRKQLQKYVHVSVPEFPSIEWFGQNGWEISKHEFAGFTTDVLIKGDLVLASYYNYEEWEKDYRFMIVDVRYNNFKEGIVFKGKIKTEEEFYIVEQILTR